MIKIRLLGYTNPRIHENGMKRTRALRAIKKGVRDAKRERVKREGSEEYGNQGQKGLLSGTTDLIAVASPFFSNRRKNRVVAMEKGKYLNKCMNRSTKR